MALLFCSTALYSQTITPTKGKEFWLGFMKNYQSGAFSHRLDVFISSTVNTTGTISIPGQGYSQNFNVTANVTTTVTIPPAMAHHLTSETIENKGVLVLTEDTVSVFAINFQEYTADGTLVLPISALGTEYRVTSYVGLSAGQQLYSEFLIVAPQDNTQIEITTTTATLGGKPAGVPWTITLNRGETYQVQASSESADLTGSTVRATAQNGACRPFAVFSGSVCTNIPVGCTACDHVYEQEYPTPLWGNSYLIPPFSFSTSYTYKVLADQSGTTFSINGGANQNLNAGQQYEANNITGGVYIQSNQDISVTQFMQGVTCSGAGDPAQLILNPIGQELFDVTFSTVTSTVITQHVANVITKSNSLSQMKLDGTVIPAGSFTPFAANPAYSYASVNLTQGSHRLHSDSGFIAYAYGTGSAESYAYALGSFSPEEVIPTDTVYCTTSSITLGPPETLNSPSWTLLGSSTVLATTQTYTVTPTSPQIYVVTGFSPLSGCEKTFQFSVEIPNPPTLTLSQSADTVCQYGDVQLNVTVTPGSNSYVYSWYPAAGLSNPSIPNPIAYPGQSGWYRVTVRTPSGCGMATDSLFIAVRPGDITGASILATKTKFCLGDSAQLSTKLEKIIFEDDFDPSIGTGIWSVISLGTASTTCGSVSGNALYFNGAGTRSAATNSYNTLAGGTIYFSLKISNGAAPCENADPGDDVVLEYSNNGGASWTIISTYLENQFPNFSTRIVTIPAAARTSATRFRWRQLANSGNNQDNWALDNVYISIQNTTAATYTWSPTAGLSSSTIANPVASPTATTLYQLTATSSMTGCIYRDSVLIEVGQPFTLTEAPDDTICQVSGVQLYATPSIAGNYTYTWTPAASVSNPSISDPIGQPTSTTNFIINVASAEGCTARDTVRITVPMLANFYATTTDDSICAGDQVQFTTVYQSSCGPHGNTCSSPATGQVGTSATTSSANNGTLYNGNFNSSRFQMLVTAAELAAAGITQASTITQLGFKVTAIAGSNIYQNFSIKMGCTSLSALTTTFNGGLTQVFNPQNVIISNAVNYYTLNSSYDWDGVSNLLIEICYSNAVTSANSTTEVTATSFNSFLSTSGAAACTTGTGTLSMTRPNIFLRSCGTPALTGLDYQWTPTADLSSSTISNPTATPDAPVVYYINATDSASGCVFRDSIPMAVGQVFTLTSQDTIVNCNSTGVQLNVTSSLPGTYSYSWSPSGGLSATNIANPVASPSTTTEYFVTVISDQGCARRDSLVVRVPIPSLYTFYATPAIDTVCSGQSVQLNTVFQRPCGANSSTCASTTTSQVGTSATTSSANNITVYKGSSTGSRMQFLYRKTELNSAGINGASTITSLGFNITAIAGSNIYQGFTIKMGCTNATELNTTFTGGLQTVLNSQNVVISNGTNFYTFNNTYDWDGVSNLVVEVCFNNAVASANSTVSYSNPGYNAAVYVTGTGVCSAATGTVSASRPNTYFRKCTANAVSTNLDFAWTPGATLSNDTISNPVASPSSTTTYFVTATDGQNGCVFTDSVLIRSSAPNPLELGNDTALCPGQTLTLSAGPGYTSYLWQNGSTDSTITVSTAGTYWVEVEDYCGTNTDTLVVTAGAGAVSVELGNDTIICSGNTVTLNAAHANASSYLWSTGVNTSSITVSTSGTYHVAVSSSCGIIRDTVSITVDQPLSIDLGNDTTLCSGTVILDAGSGFSSYVWQDNSTNQTYTATAAGTYFVQAMNACGSDRDTILINYLITETLDLGPDTTFCEGNDLVLDASISNSNAWLWNDMATDSIRIISSSGTYSVQVNTLCGIQRDTISVLVNPLPFVDLGNDSALCNGTVILNAGPGFSSYSWQDGSGNQTYTATTTGNYWVTVTNTCGFARDTISLNFNAAPQISLGRDTVICPGNSYVLSPGGGNNFTWLWSDGSTDTLLTVTMPGIYSVQVATSCGISRDTVEIGSSLPPSPVSLGRDTVICQSSSFTLNAGTQTGVTYLWQNGATTATLQASASGQYWVAVSNSCGTVRDTINIIFSTQPTVALGNDTSICPGSSFTISETGSAGTQYLWSTGNTTNSLSISAAGTYWLRETNLCGTASDTIKVSFRDLPTVSLGNDTSFCSGSTATFSVTPVAGNTYLWSTGSSSTSIQVTSPGTYWIRATNICGSASDTAKVLNVFTSPVVDLGQDSGLCVNRTITLSSNITGTFLWSTGATTSSIQASNIGTYWLQVTDANGCRDKDSVTIFRINNPLISLGGDTAICYTASVTIGTVNPEYTYSWSTGETTPTITVSDSGFYSVQVSNECGSDNDTIKVSSIDCVCWIDLPTAFSPNNDGTNDQMKLVGNCMVNIEFYIFDRWGEKVFEAHDLVTAWDGTYKGKALETGVFVYYLKAVSGSDGTEVIKKGNISLLR